MRAQKKFILLVGLQQQHCDSDRKSKQRDVGRLEATCSTRCHIDSQGKPRAPAAPNTRKQFVYCSMLKRSSRQSGSSKKTAWLTMHVEKRDSTGALSWRDCIGSIQKNSPYHILGKLTSRTKKERYEGGWKEGTEVTGQYQYQRVHNRCY